MWEFLSSSVDEVFVGCSPLHTHERGSSVAVSHGFVGSDLLAGAVDGRQDSTSGPAFRLPLRIGLGRTNQHFKCLRGICKEEKRRRLEHSTKKRSVL